MLKPRSSRIRPSRGRTAGRSVALTGAVHPHQPRSAVVAGAAQVRPPPSPGRPDRRRPATRKHRIVLERQLLVGQPASRRRRIDFARKGSGSACAPSMPSADSSSAAAAHALQRSLELGRCAAVQRHARQAKLVEHHLAELARADRRAPAPVPVDSSDAAMCPREHQPQFAADIQRRSQRTVIS